MAIRPMPQFEQLDGLRGPLSLGVIAINMGLYNAGANTPVGFFLILSGLFSFIAYGGAGNDWSDQSRARFFMRRLHRLLPMLLVSTVFQLCTSALYLIRPGVANPETLQSGGRFSFVVTVWSLVLILAGSGILCRNAACGCCHIDAAARGAEGGAAGGVTAARGR